MDDLRTVFHLPINDAAKKVRKKKHALVILVRRNKQQQQQEQKTKENFFLLWVFWVHLFLGATFTLFVFFARRRIWLFTQNSPPYDCPLSLKYTSWAYA